MRASHIFINPQGVPCALTKTFPLGERAMWSKTEQYELKQSSIPIREEDERLAFQLLMDQPGYTGSFSNDTFYLVEPYEFEVISDKSDIQHEMPSYARIIRPSEPKANPSKELYSIPVLEWIKIGDRQFNAELGDYRYSIEKIYHSNKWRGFVSTGGECEDRLSEKCFASSKEGMQAAQTHFESKLKQMLNREI